MKFQDQYQDQDQSVIVIAAVHVPIIDANVVKMICIALIHVNHVNQIDVLILNRNMIAIIFLIEVFKSLNKSRVIFKKI